MLAPFFENKITAQKFYTLPCRKNTSQMIQPLSCGGEETLDVVFSPGFAQPGGRKSRFANDSFATMCEISAFVLKNTLFHYFVGAVDFPEDVLQRVARKF